MIKYATNKISITNIIDKINKKINNDQIYTII